MPASPCSLVAAVGVATVGAASPGRSAIPSGQICAVKRIETAAPVSSVPLMERPSSSALAGISAGPMKKPRISSIDQVNGISMFLASGVQPSAVRLNVSARSFQPGPPSGKPSASTRLRRSRFSPGARSLLTKRGIGPLLVAFPATGHSLMQPFRVLCGAPLSEGDCDAGVPPPHAATSRSAVTKETLRMKRLYRRFGGCRVSLR